MNKALRACALLAVSCAALFPATASAAAPTLGPIATTDLQGVSALLKGTVNPGGQATTYRFEYVDQAHFQVNQFATATATAITSVGSGSEDRDARAAISGLTPETGYRFRLRADNANGSVTSATAAFTTTHGFGFLPGSAGFAAGAVADGGAAASAAGSHPYQLGFHIGFNLGGEFEGQPGVAFADGDLRNLTIQMPPGLIQNPAALPKCPIESFGTPRSSPFEASRSGESCPNSTQVGTIDVHTSLDGGQVRRFGLFNLVPPPGVPAEIGFAPFGTPIVLDSELLPTAAGEYVLAFEAHNFPQTLDVRALDLVLWGTPWAVSHNGERGNCLNEAEPDFPWAKCSMGSPIVDPPKAYLTMPASCAAALTFAARADSWQQPTVAGREAVNRDGLGSPVPLNCAGVAFQPRLEGLLTTTKASSASGFAFRLSNDEEELLGPASRIESQVRDAVATLPDGVTINASLGAGLGVCSPGQYAAESVFSAEGQACPNASKIGDFRVRTPLYEGWLEGAIYLAQPDDPASAASGSENPFDTLLAVYLVARLPQRGLFVKLAGKIVPDPVSGRLTATFEGLPQLPYSELEVNFRSGQRAPLVSPPSCGPATTRIAATSWLGPGSTAQVNSDSPIQSGIAGACPTGAAPPFAPAATAGGVNSNVGSYTPYFVRLTRRDSEQEITSYSLVLPRGITGKLAGIPFCSDAAIAAARGRAGVAETASPSCPAASQVGHTLTGYGVGSALTYAPGGIYLAGPYHGSPLSLVTIDAATVGPFDLGTIVIRSAFQVDPHTAQLQIDARASDPIPHILHGIPLHLREIRVYMDRPQFTRNPTSCEPSEMVSTLTGSGARFGDSSDDSVATVRQGFQLLNCRSLGFRPKLGVRLRGGSRRGAYPSLRATFAARGPQDSNLKQIGVTMPRALFLAQNHIRGICTRPQFDAERCPADSAYGSAVAYTPLFDAPLRGDVYLRSSSGKLPDLVASLHSGAVRIILEGKIGPAKGGIRVQFEDLPDAPIDRFTMTLSGGKHGLLVNSTNICATPPAASVKALGQNSAGAIFTTKLRGQCGGKPKKKGGKGTGKRRRGR